MSDPNKDPATLIQELSTLLTIVETRLQTRIESIGKDIERHNTEISGLPAQVDTKVNHLQSLHDEKFNSIQVQFTERDVRTEQSYRDSKAALDIALQAAKEAVVEQNKASALIVDKQDLLAQTMIANINDTIADIRRRLALIEHKISSAQPSTVI